MSRYLEMMEERFPTPAAAKAERMNLEAVLNLPKGTELFLSDIHGEYRSFDHILRIGSGNLKEKIKDAFQSELSAEEVEQLNLLVAYPKKAMDTEWYKKQDKKQLLYRLTELLRFTSVKYSRSKVRKALPNDYCRFIEDLVYTDTRFPEKRAFLDTLINELLVLHEEETMITQIAETIQHLVIDHLHVVGDIFDRGTQADRVMDRLMQFPSVDIQWGNHDILWMGAFFGSEACLLNLLRIAVRYGYLFDLEKRYGLNLRRLFSYSQQVYGENDAFRPKVTEGQNEHQIIEMERVHQALTIMQFKAEEQLLIRRPEFKMADRKLLHQIDYRRETLQLEGEEYKIRQGCFQAIDPKQPENYTEREKEVVASLMYSFQHSQKMRQHILFLLEKGGMYLVYNHQLLFHGCMPLDEEGEFLALDMHGEKYAGRELLAFFDEQIRVSAKDIHQGSDFATDLIWYGWSGPISPLFGKTKMATFERYFLKEKETHKEEKNLYYQLRDQKGFVEKLLRAFDVTEPGSVIINGHTPVKARKGESPIKADGKLFVIDGGLSKAYQKTTGIAGYSLLSNSYGFQIVTHQPLHSVQALFDNQEDQTYVKRVLDQKLARKAIRDTDKGKDLEAQLADINELLKRYREQKPEEVILGK